MTDTRYRAAAVGGCLRADIVARPDRTWLLRSTERLRAFPLRLTDCLEHWADSVPDRVLAAERDAAGQWVQVTYAQMLSRARAVGAALVARGLDAQRPVAVISGNSIDHLTLALGAMWAGVPYAPISPAYSLMSRDFGKLKHVMHTLTPGLVFAQSSAFERAIATSVARDVEVVLSDDGVLRDRTATAMAELLATDSGSALDEAHERVGADTIAKLLFTSGSTKAPKAVINTHRMLCSNQQMKRQCFAFLAKEPPVLVDWLPWNHTFGGNHNVGLVLYNGGTLYIDAGTPTPHGIAETLRNLREVSPTVYFNVPRGLEEIAHAMEHDDVLRETLFRRLRMFMFAGAGLSQAVWDRIDQLAERTIGQRVPVFTGLGMTETSPTSMLALRAGQVASGHLGLPCPGVEAKLVPVDDKLEVRFRGPHVTPGYFRAPELTAEAFDEEGFYRTGDAVRFLDLDEPQRGLCFDGRIVEDFKLSSGTFVSVGPLRAKVVMDGAPCVQDVVVAGINEREIGILVVPRVESCRRVAGVGAEATIDDVLRHDHVRDFFRRLAQRLWDEGSGSSNRVARMCLLCEPLSLDRGEITDKGSINQRAVLSQRAELVSAMFAGQSDPTLTYVASKC